MATLRLFMVSSFLVLTLLPSPFSPLTPSKLVRADDEFIHRECHNAEVPATCIECIKSDPRGLTADAVGIATIVVDCVSKLASNLQGNMSTLAAGTSDAILKEAYQECSKWFSYAKKALYAATIALKSRGYDCADQSVSLAFQYRFACKNQIQVNDSMSAVPVSGQMLYELNVYEELSQAAMRIINRL